MTFSLPISWRLPCSTTSCLTLFVPPCQVSGDKNEEQVLNAIEAYTEHRPEITSRAINLLFDIARIERCSQLLRALQVSPVPALTAPWPGKCCSPSLFLALGHCICTGAVALGTPILWAASCHAWTRPYFQACCSRYTAQ